MNTKTYLLPLILLSLILLSSCDKNNNYESISPCKSSMKDTSFRIGEWIGYPENQRFFESDTIVASRKNISLVANDSLADEYIWNFDISSQVFKGRSINLKLEEPLGAIQVTLTIKRDSGNQCFGILPSQAVYKKSIVVVGLQENPLIGTYLGYNSSEKNKPLSIQILSNGIKNLPFTTIGDYVFQNEIIYGSSAFYIAGAGTYDPLFGAYATEGFGYLTSPGKIKIDYQYKKPLNPSGYTVIKDTFFGIKQ